MEQNTTHGKVKRDWLLPASILIAAILISGALVYNAGKNGSDTPVRIPSGGEESVSLEKMRPISENDYVRGNPDAPIKIVEYSDLECPFCKDFHRTLIDTLKLYGDKVAWVYRHAPLDQSHRKARKEAEAVECAGEIGGKEKFWTYMDRLMEVTPSNNGLDLKKLPEIATYVGIDKSKFEQCLSSGKYAEKIQNDLENAMASGFRGTPYSIVVVNNKPKGSLPGALPLDEQLQGNQPNLKTILDQEIDEL
jgi:protein-disulfide isomerase